MIIIKNKFDIKKMKKAGEITAKVLNMIKKYIVPGISTGELDDICKDYIYTKKKVISACLGYQGYPRYTCISKNTTVCHGIPNYKQKIKNGDIINIDISIIKDGYFGDSSKMFFVGQCSSLAKKLCKITKKSLYEAIKIVKPNLPLRKIGKTIQKIAEKNNFSVVREYCGHGIGKNFHEEPYVLHYDNHDNTILLKQGMIFTIEPMINAGKKDIYCKKDKWTVKTKDNSLSAQYEHTILVTKNGYKVLTLRKNEKIV
ncbi:type I methionyl aminopeptidase [Buchnera aphidicola (Chaitophorus viminalis)]|nr:type I methionyl aminopeptidase [Buchnera aphidicola]MCW5197756.1 type I methionyl aminopeptidase [Buchnera aphidicola (Chaitophorus viminalis)]